MVSLREKYNALVQEVAELRKKIKELEAKLQEYYMSRSVDIENME